MIYLVKLRLGIVGEKSLKTWHVAVRVPALSVAPDQQIAAAQRIALEWAAQQAHTIDPRCEGVAKSNFCRAVFDPAGGLDWFVAVVEKWADDKRYKDTYLVQARDYWDASERAFPQYDLTDEDAAPIKLMRANIEAYLAPEPEPAPVEGALE